jgi:hypothetical protein
VLLTPNYDRSRPWDTTMIRASGPSSLTAEEVRDFDQLWNHRPAGG